MIHDTIKADYVINPHQTTVTYCVSIQYTCTYYSRLGIILFEITW